MEIPIFKTIILLVIGIIGFFIKGLIVEIKKGMVDMKKKLGSHDISIKLLESKNDGLDKRIDQIFDLIKQMSNDTKDSIKELSNDIKLLTKELSNKKDKYEK